MVEYETSYRVIEHLSAMNMYCIILRSHVRRLYRVRKTRQSLCGVKQPEIGCNITGRGSPSVRS